MAVPKNSYRGIQVLEDFEPTPYARARAAEAAVVNWRGQTYDPSRDVAAFAKEPTGQIIQVAAPAPAPVAAPVAAPAPPNQDVLAQTLAQLGEAQRAGTWSAPTTAPAEAALLGAGVTPPTKGEVLPSWNYSNYLNVLRTPGNDYRSSLANLSAPEAGLGADAGNRAQTIYDQIKQQQDAGTKSAWSSGKLANTDAAAADFALRLTEAGLSSLYDLGQRTVEFEEIDPEIGYPTRQTRTEYFNKATGEPLKDWNRLANGLGMGYRFSFQNGVPIPYTEKEKSGWVDFRDSVVRPALSLGAAFIPGVGPYIAAANAVYSASKGEWDKAILSALGAAAPIAGQMGAAASTVSNIADVNKYAKILKALDDKDLLGAALQGASVAGIKDIAGVSTADIQQALRIGKAIQSENPLALIAAMAKTAGRSDKPTSLVGESIEDIEMIPGYFDADTSQDRTFGGGYVDMSEFLVQPTPIEIPEIAASEPDLGELVITAPRPEPETDLGELVVTAPRPERPELDLGVDLDSDEWLVQPSPIDIPGVVAPPAAPPPSSKPPTAAPPPSASRPVDLSQLLALLYSQEAPYTAYVPENAADIELMEEIFGTSLSAPSTGKRAELAVELARLLRS